MFCQFCDFEGERCELHSHHIIPKEVQVENRSWNLLFVCPTCHNRIYIPESKSGIHSIKKSNSIIVKQWYPSTHGRVLEFIDHTGKVQFVEDRNLEEEFSFSS